MFFWSFFYSHDISKKTKSVLPNLRFPRISLILDAKNTKDGFNREGCWAHFIRVLIEFELILIIFALILDAKNTRVASTAKAAERILFEL